MNYKVIAIRFVGRLRKTFFYSLMKKIKFKCLAPFTTNKIHMNTEVARKVLEDFHSNPKSECIHKNKIDNDYAYDLTVVVPCYNVEHYVLECVNSIVNQETKYKYNIVLIDDGSTDDTGKILDSFCDLQNVTVIHQENNGIAGARNQALYHIMSKYITFVDSDDYLVPGAIQNMLDVAYEQNADIVEGSHYRLYNDKLVKSVTHKLVVSNGSAINLIGMAWGKIYRSTLFENVIFPERMCFEDSICSFLIYPSAPVVVTIPDYVYVYRIIINSISHSSARMARSVDTIWVTELMLKDHAELNLNRNPSYSDLIIKQIVLNYNRLKKLPKEIQLASFVVTCDIFAKYCDSLEFKSSDKYLVNSMNEFDYGKYKLFCETR